MQSIVFLHTLYHIVHRDFLSSAQFNDSGSKQGNHVLESNISVASAKQSMAYLQEYLLYFCVDHRPNVR